MDLSKLYGSKSLTVTKRNGSTQDIVIKALTLREIPKYAAAFQDEAARIELAAGLPANWATGNGNDAEALTDESHIAALEAADALNFSRAVAWADRQSAQEQAALPIAPNLARKAAANRPPAATSAPPSTGAPSSFTPRPAAASTPLA